MTITLYSIVTTLILTSILSLAIFMCRKNLLFIKLIGVKPLIFLLICCLVRLLLPMEFPFTREVRVPHALNPVYEFYHTSLPNNELSSLTLFVVIWLIISTILMIYYMFAYQSIFKKIIKIPLETTEQVTKIVDEIVLNKENVTVLVSNLVTVPMVCGFRKCFILLPKIDYSDSELWFIIKHEYSHFTGKDSYIRLLIQVFCCLFWWNPFVYLMKIDLDNILEIRCDNKVIQDKNKLDVISYAETILKFAKERTYKKRLFITSEFSNDKAVKQRFKLLFIPMLKPKTQKLMSAFTWFLIVALMVFSYSFVLQSEYYPAQIKYETNSIILEENQDGTYTINKNGKSFVIDKNAKNQIIVEDSIIK